MARKVTISLDDEVLKFVDEEAQRLAPGVSAPAGRANRSGFINAVLAQARKRRLDEELAAAYKRDADDPVWREAAREWDQLAGDGLGA